MDQNRMQDLIIGLAFNTLEDDERNEAEELLKTDAQARKLLADCQEIVAGLALSVAPVELPSGSLGRLRQKAGISAPQAEKPIATLTQLSSEPTVRRPEPPLPPKVIEIRRPNRGWAGFAARPLVAYAAALVLFVTTLVFGALWLNARNDVPEAERNQRELAVLLASPNLKVTELKAGNGNTFGTMRVFVDPATDKAILVAQNLTLLQSDKEYEAWLIGDDNQPRKAALLGAGGNGTQTLVQPLTATGEIEQYKQVAITVEKKGGSDKPTQSPVMTGSLAA